jgi:hypothetical protein
MISILRTMLRFIYRFTARNAIYMKMLATLSKARLSYRASGFWYRYWRFFYRCLGRSVDLPGAVLHSAVFRPISSVALPTLTVLLPLARRLVCNAPGLGYLAAAFAWPVHSRLEKTDQARMTFGI